MMHEVQKTAAELLESVPALQKNAQGQLSGGFTLLGGIFGPLGEIFDSNGICGNFLCSEPIGK